MADSIFDSLAPGENPTYDDLVKAVRELYDGKSIGLGDLPMQAIKNNLEQTWQPDVSSLLLPASVPLDRLQSPVVSGEAGTSPGVRFGTSTATFSGSPISGTAVVTHGLGKTPACVLTTAINTVILYEITASGATTFSVAGYNTTGAALTGTFSFYWLAIG